MLLSLAFVFGVGSLTTFRQRRLASPTSILEIEATHPLVNHFHNAHYCIALAADRCVNRWAREEAFILQSAPWAPIRVS